MVYPIEKIPAKLPLSLEIENMVDSAEDEEPHKCLWSHYVTLQCDCVTPSGSVEYEPYLAH